MDKLREAREHITKCEHGIQEVLNVKQNYSERLQVEEDRLKSLENVLPKLIVSCQLGEEDEAQVDSVRGEIRTLRDSIDATVSQQVIKLLDGRVSALNVQIRAAKSTLKKFNKYRTLKDHLTENSMNIRLAGDLRLYAKALDLQEDCEAFLSSLTGKAA